MKRLKRQFKVKRINKMISAILAASIIVTSLQCNRYPVNQLANTQHYYFYFGCCFNSDSVLVLHKDEIIFKSTITTNDNTGRDNLTFFRFPIPIVEDSLLFNSVLERKVLTIRLRNSVKNQFVYIYKYRDSLYYQQEDHPIKSE